MPTWLITGCSTGLGRALATAVLAGGDNAVATARSADSVRDLAERYPDTALALALEVTDAGQVAASVRRAEERFGGVDVLVNNAGYGYRAAAGRSLAQSAEAIVDYADTAGRRRKEHDRTHGTQPGDPARAAEAIITALGAPEPPALLLLGSDAVAAARDVLDAQRAELEAWGKLAAGTDFTG